MTTTLSLQDNPLQSYFERFTEYLSSAVFYSFDLPGGAQLPLVLVWLISGALVCTFGLKFINLRGFKHAAGLLKSNRKTGDAGQISPYQALSTALSGTVGTGNIAGVALAIGLGGPGATFWMIIAGFLGMSTKFVECTLAVKYRQVNSDGSVNGGPMYYIQAALGKIGFAGTGKVLSIFFCIACIFGAAGFVHVNQAFVQVKTVTGFDNALLFGSIYAFFVAIVVVGGIKSIARVTSHLVPLMCAVYLSAALLVIFWHITEIPQAFYLIIKSAFAPEAAYGGAIGVMIQGFRRAAYSNEAGLGSSPIAHAASQTKDPVSQGFIALLEPFIDTVVICTITALVIIVTGAYLEPGDGVEMTSNAFASVFSWFPWLLMVSLLLFGYTTVIGWFYYGLSSFRYIFGQKKVFSYLYKIIFCFIVAFGAIPNVLAVFNFIDSMIFLMSVPNILALYLLLPEVRADLKDYIKRHNI
ncbi:alanine/glycine:cation symporter family protein [Chromatiaceae bacterium AAb-1]|nr:alanine/glycine:cation symporter family protein [Chromatiaceae bacterium AAb-1]